MGRHIVEHAGPAGDAAAFAYGDTGDDRIWTYPYFVFNHRVSRAPLARCIDVVALPQRDAVKECHVAADAGVHIDHDAARMCQGQPGCDLGSPWKLNAGPLAGQSMQDPGWREQQPAQG